MTLATWIETNDKMYNGDLVVVGIKEGSIKTGDVLFTTVTSKMVAKQIFGNYILKQIRVAQYPNNEGYSLRMLVDIPTETVQNKSFMM